MAPMTAGSAAPVAAFRLTSPARNPPQPSQLASPGKRKAPSATGIPRHLAELAVRDDPSLPEEGCIPVVVLRALTTQYEPVHDVAEPLPAHLSPAANAAVTATAVAAEPSHRTRSAAKTSQLGKPAATVLAPASKPVGASIASDPRVPVGPSILATLAPADAFHASLQAHRARTRESAPSAISARVAQQAVDVWGSDVEAAKSNFTQIAVGLYMRGRETGTWDAQTTALRVYNHFCDTYQFAGWPVSERVLIPFTVWSAPHRQVSTISKYVGHLRTYSEETRQPMPLNKEMPFWQRVCNGLEKAQASVKGKEIRLPITFKLCCLMISVKRRSITAAGRDPRHMPLYSMENPFFSEAVAALALVAACRPGEFTVRTTRERVVTAPLRLKHWRVHDARFALAAGDGGPV